MMSQRPASADEQQAFTQQRESQAKYGKYGKGGLERKKMGLEAGMKEKELKNARRLRGMMETGETGRETYAQDTLREQNRMQYHPGDLLTPKGTEHRKMDVDQSEAEARQRYYDMMMAKEKAPKVFQRTDEETGAPTYDMLHKDENGEYRIVPVPMSGRGTMQQGSLNPQAGTPAGQQKGNKPLTPKELKEWEELQKRMGWME
jgi:hypothetical protein